MSELDDLLKSLLVERFRPPPRRTPYNLSEARDAHAELLNQLDRERPRRATRRTQTSDSDGTRS